MSSSRATVHCKRCGLTRPHKSRQLCEGCYRTVTRHDMRDFYPTKAEEAAIKAYWNGGS